MPSLLERAKLKLKSAQTAKTKEERARERVSKAVNRIQLEAAHEKLRAARIERGIKEAQAQAALERARAGLNLAKAGQTRASTQKWMARYDRAGVIMGGVARPTASGAKLAGKGLKQLGDWLWDKPSPRRRTVKRRATTARRPVARKATAKRSTVRKSTARKRTRG